MRKTFHIGFLGLLLAMPICALLASPVAAQSATRVLSLWQPERWLGSE